MQLIWFLCDYSGLGRQETNKQPLPTRKDVNIERAHSLFISFSGIHVKKQKQKNRFSKRTYALPMHVHTNSILSGPTCENLYFLSMGESLTEWMNAFWCICVYNLRASVWVNGPYNEYHSPTPRNGVLMAQTRAAKDFQILCRVQDVTQKCVCLCVRGMVAERRSMLLV